MTKNILKSSILYIFVLFFSACSNPVFYNISKEVRLQDATVMGSINSIVRFTQNGKEYLVCQNGNTLYYKETGTERVSNESVWTARPNKTFQSFYYSYEEGDYKGEYVLKCAADSNFVYLLTAELRIDLDRGEAVPKCYRLYSTNDLFSDSWTPLESFSKNLNSYISDNVYKGYPLLFCTNSINTANRVAFIRNNDTSNTNNTQNCKYYKLSGGSEPAEIMPPESRLDGTTGLINSAVWFNGNVQFFGSSASATNEKSDTPADKIYYGKGSELYYYDGTNSTSTCKGTGTISCIAVTEDCLLFGQNESNYSTVLCGGLYKVKKDTQGIPGNSLEAFSTNADAVFTSSYQILTLLAENPDEKEMDNSIYATIDFRSSGSSIAVSFENIGLWAYYPKRGNWNRE